MDAAFLYGQAMKPRQPPTARLLKFPGLVVHVLFDMGFRLQREYRTLYEALTEASHVTYADVLFGFSEQRTCVPWRAQTEVSGLVFSVLLQPMLLKTPEICGMLLTLKTPKLVRYAFGRWSGLGAPAPRSAQGLGPNSTTAVLLPISMPPLGTSGKSCASSAR